MNLTPKNVFSMMLTSIALASLWASADKSPQKKAADLSAENVYRGINPALTPDLAHSGDHIVGVKTIDIVNPKQLNIATQAKEDRRLRLEIWYPAKKKGGSKKAIYQDVTRTHQPFSLRGTAFREAPALSKKRFPLVVMSHGYTGYRTIMYYLGEHLASHGYVVASIDHTDSTNADVDSINAPFSGFPSTLFNRSRDQQFVLNYLTDIQHRDFPNIDPNTAGLIGYSMGGYGAINTVGGCYQFTQALTSRFTGINDPEQLKNATAMFNSCSGGQYKDVQVDRKWKAAIAISPWGNRDKLFDTKSLSKFKVPILFVSGDHDDISDYPSIRSLFLSLKENEAYLLTYQHARHNIAPHPAPKVAIQNEFDSGHYWEASWNLEQLNSINEHFSLAMMNCHLKKMENACAYLDLPPSSTQTLKDGKLSAPWKGFPDRFSTGMLWEKSAPK